CSASEENATERTKDLCSLKDGDICAPDLASQTRTVWSFEPEMTWVPSGENAMHLTSPLWPRSDRASVPESTSHIRMMLSVEPDAIQWPSLEKAIDRVPPMSL